ncbi:MAG: ferrochelatase [Verrucomicrobiia bacterium]
MKAVLLVNLGSPDSPNVPDVRRYLREFLSDSCVIDSPWLVRQLVLNLFILPFRPKQSAAAYQTIWTQEGSPLLVISRQVQSLLQQQVSLPVALAMRYGKPSIPKILQLLHEQRVTELFLIPLYPHYAMSSYETVVKKVQETLRNMKSKIQLTIQPPFYNEPHYVKALVESATPYLQQDYDHLLFSFHGIPERHIKKADISGCHCLIQPNCCETSNPAHEFCYRAQTRKTVAAFVQAAKIHENKFSIAYQSRLGRDPWLKPYTDLELERFPKSGIKKLLVICPAFVSDCLETLEEIAERGKETFLHAGGENFTMIPCLNTHPVWVDTLKYYIQNFAK